MFRQCLLASLFLLPTTAKANFLGDIAAGVVANSLSGSGGQAASVGEIKERMQQVNSFLWNMHEQGKYDPEYQSYIDWLDSQMIASGYDNVSYLDTIAWAYKDNGNREKAVEIYKNRVLPWVKIYFDQPDYLRKWRVSFEKISEYTDKKMRNLSANAGKLNDLDVGKAFSECDHCPEMVVLPEGDFLMGAPDGERESTDRERPQRSVSISTPISISRYEITFRQWDACAADGGCQTNPTPPDADWGRGDKPVFNVSWGDTQEYLVWINSKVEGAPYRLPTEAEWEYSARAGTTGAYAFGETISELLGNFEKKRSSIVGGYPANNFGLHDFHGNVWEWTEDCWHRSYEGAPNDGSAWLGTAKGDCERRVLRGGSWDSRSYRLRSALRGVERSGYRSKTVGFRVVRDLSDAR